MMVQYTGSGSAYVDYEGRVFATTDRSDVFGRDKELTLEVDQYRRQGMPGLARTGSMRGTRTPRTGAKQKRPPRDTAMTEGDSCPGETKMHDNRGQQRSTRPKGAIERAVDLKLGVVG